MEDKLNLILKKLESLETEVKGELKELKTGQEELTKKVSSMETEMKERFDKSDSRFNHLEKEIHRNRFLLEDAMNTQYAEMIRKQDRILSATENFAHRTKNNEEEFTVLSHRVREHEDRITALEEKVR